MLINKRLKSLVLPVTLMLSVFLTACTQYTANSTSKVEEDALGENTAQAGLRQYNVLGESYLVPSGSSVWEAQLKKIIENNSALEKKGLQLLSYKLDKKINSERELGKLKNEMEPMIPDFDRQSQKFKLDDIKMSKQDFNVFLDMIMPTSLTAKQQTVIKPQKDGGQTGATYFFENNDLSTVNLQWEYEGKSVYTTCFVSEKKGIVYDNILYFITDKELAISH